MKKFCRKLCCCFSCCRCCKKVDYIKNVTNLTRLLPEPEDKLEDNEPKYILSFGIYTQQFKKELFNLSDISKYKVKAISFGNEHTLILFSDGSVYGIGKNNDGQLGKQITKDKNDYNEFVNLKLNDKIKDLIKSSNITILDISCGDTFSNLLVTANEQERIIRFGISTSDRYRDELSNISTQVRFL